MFALEQELPKLDEQMDSYKKELSTLTCEYTKIMELTTKIDELEQEILIKTERYFELMEKKES